MSNSIENPTSILINSAGTEIGTASNPVRVNPTGTTAQPITDNGGSITVDGTVNAAQSGTWNVTNISGSVSLPTGASTSSLQTSGNSSLSSIDTKTPALGQAVMSSSTPVTIASDQSEISTKQSERATFVVWAQGIAPANNKCMVFVRNAAGSTVTVKILSIKVINPQTAGVTGVVGILDLRRVTSLTSPTEIVPLPFDTTDSLDGLVTAGTGGTVVGEASSSLGRRYISTDEWGPGALDVEGAHNTITNALPMWDFDRKGCRPLTLRANEGVMIAFRTNSTAGALDFEIVFTQE